MPLTTPLFGLKYLAVGEPARNTRQVLEDNAKTVEAALVVRGVTPPAVVDLAAEASARASADAALDTRLQVLEPGAWTALSLVGGYSSYAAPATYPVVSYRKEGRRAWLRGWLLNSGAVAGNTAVTSSPLPVPLRPVGSNATLWVTTDTGTLRRFEVRTDGHLYTFGALTASTYINLEPGTWALP